MESSHHKLEVTMNDLHEEKPLVSIITPSYDSEAFIEQMIESVLAQQYSNWELIIVDDCSPDGSNSIVEQYANSDPRIRLIKLKNNSGAAVARNKAIEFAKSRYIAFLDSDDLWKPNKLEVQIGFMQKHKLPFTFTKYDVIDEENNFVNSVGVPDKVSYSDLLKTNYIGCLTAVYDADYFGKVQMPLIRRRQDYGLWLSLLKKTDYAYGVNESLAKYRLRAGSISSNKATTSMYTWKLYREFEKLNLVKALYYFSNYSIRAILRRKFPNFARKLGVLA
jgi:glycosyltransferase involved in cell wall biosynthesis